MPFLLPVDNLCLQVLDGFTVGGVTLLTALLVSLSVISRIILSVLLLCISRLLSKNVSVRLILAVRCGGWLFLKCGDKVRTIGDHRTVFI